VSTFLSFRSERGGARQAPARRRSRTVFFPAAALFFALGSFTGALAQEAVPALQGRVTDLTSTLSPQQRSTLDEKLRAFEERKGSQVAVLIVPTTDPEDIAAYGIRVADAWKLGRKGVDDGAILIVAKNDRRLRVEVGYGLEGALTDAISRRIIDETIVPRFRQGDYYEGINAGVDQMLRVIDGEPLPEPQRQWQRETGLFELLPFLLVGLIIAGSLFRTLFGRFGGALATGGAAGGVTWFLTYLLGAAATAGIIGFIAALVLGGFGGPRGWSGGGRGRRSGWGDWITTSGGFGGGRGGFGGGGFGGGGFGGGGGGFGGGGASGGW